MEQYRAINVQYTTMHRASHRRQHSTRIVPRLSPQPPRRDGPGKKSHSFFHWLKMAAILGHLDQSNRSYFLCITYLAAIFAVPLANACPHANHAQASHTRAHTVPPAVVRETHSRTYLNMDGLMSFVVSLCSMRLVFERNLFLRSTMG